MIVFITSIRHPENSNSYSKIWSLLENTLISVCNQIHKDFKVIIVANSILDGFEDRSFAKYLEFVEVDFAPPRYDRETKNKVNTGMEAIRIDRSTKYVVGLVAAKKYNPDYIMFFDADDYVSNKISEFVNNNVGENGFYVNKGYKSYGDKLSFIKSGFFNSCGTCNIFNYDLFMSKIGDKIFDIELSQDNICDFIDNYFLKKIIGSHKFAVSYFYKQHTPLMPLPFPGAIYLLDTGENHSRENESYSIADRSWGEKGAGFFNRFGIKMD